MRDGLFDWTLGAEVGGPGIVIVGPEDGLREGLFECKLGSDDGARSVGPGV